MAKQPIRKKHFREATSAQIRNTYATTRSANTGDYLGALVDSYEDQAFIIDRDLTPERFKDKPRKSMRHGDVIWMPTFTSVDDANEKAMRMLGWTRERHPEYTEGSSIVLFRNFALDRSSGNPCCYSFGPFRENDIDPDKTPRRIAPVDCEEGARLYAYPHQVPRIGDRPSITIEEEFVSAKKVGKEGGVLVVRVPSRTEGRGRYKFSIHSFPVEDVPDKWAVAYDIGTNHVCDETLYNIRFVYGEDPVSSRVYSLCPHEIAAILESIDHFVHEHDNRVPLDMCQIALPTQFIVSLADKFRYNALIKTSSDRNPRKLLKWERNKILFDAIKQFGAWETFYIPPGKKVRELRWRHLDDIVT